MQLLKQELLQNTEVTKYLQCTLMATPTALFETYIPGQRNLDVYEIANSKNGIQQDVHNLPGWLITLQLVCFTDPFYEVFSSLA